MNNSDDNVCVFCGEEANVTRDLNRPDVPRYVCPRCGPYCIAERHNRSPADDPTERFQLACVAIERRSRGLGGFTLCQAGDRGRLEGNWDRYPLLEKDDMLAQFPEPADIVTRSLQNFYRFAAQPFELQSHATEDLGFLTYCQGSREARVVVQSLEDRGLLAVKSMTSQGVDLHMTADGLEFIRQLTRGPLDSDQGFIAMAIRDSTHEIWKQGLEPGIKNAGWASLRIDDQEHNDKICDRIIAAIRQSRFVVVDATHARPAVLFEAGFAKGFGLDVIWVVSKKWLADEDHDHKLNFDTQQYSHIMYDVDDLEGLRRDLRDRILATIGPGPVRTV